MSETTLNRRNFIAGSAAMAGATMLAGAAASTALANDTAAEPWLPEKWDEECDVVIAGFGASGVSAAIYACELGLKTIVLEKSPIEDGGNFGCSTGHLHTTLKAADPDAWIEHEKHDAMRGLPDMTVIDDEWAEMQQVYDWLHGDLGLDFFEGLHHGGAGDSYFYYYYRTEKGTPGAGNEFFAKLASIAHEKGADIRTASPLVDLVQNPITKEVLGAVYTDGMGATHYIKTHKGVIICTGGYESNKEMQSTFNFCGIYCQPWGSPNNDGSGIRIAQKHGADLWHMQAMEWSTCGYRGPSEEAGCGGTMRESGRDHIDPFIWNYIWVNRDGKRFMDEETKLTHNLDNKPFTVWDGDKYSNLPFWMVFDSRIFDQVQLWQGTGFWGLLDSYAGVQNLIDAEDFNNKALAKGWIIKANSLEELAAQMTSTDPKGDEATVDAEGLVAEVKHWNEMVKNGKDADFKRWGLADIAEEGPYYAIELCPCIINTQGGPRRDGQCRTIDVAGNPIPRLYNCGECGSLNPFVYILGNIVEALANGRMAVRSAANLDTLQ